MDQPTSQEAPTPATDNNPPRTSPWVWVALTTGIIALVVSVGSSVFPFFMFMDDLEGEEFDEPGSGYYVEQRSVLNAIEEPCELMLEAAEDVNLGGPADQSTASLKQWTAAAQDIVAAVDGADPDKDSQAWRDDWKATIKAVNTFADNIGKARNQLTLPDVESMYYETDAECGVPVVIAGLDKEWAGYVLGA